MVKDIKTGDVLRADHLVKNVLEARIAGDKEARGQAVRVVEDEKDKKKKKSKPVKLLDEVVAEYERILAQVSSKSYLSDDASDMYRSSWTITLAQN